MKHVIALLVILASMIACSIPAQAPTVRPAAIITSTPTEALCAFVEGRQQLAEISDQLLISLKNAKLPVENARAEAYGENCIAEDGSLVRFSARETDFYVTVTVTDPLDEAMLADFLEKTLVVIDQFPVDQTPGPNPGYVSFTVMVDQNIVHMLWFTQIRANDLRAQGLQGINLYHALQSAP